MSRGGCPFDPSTAVGAGKPSFSPPSGAIRCMVKRCEGKTYPLIVNGETRPWRRDAQLL